MPIRYFFQRTFVLLIFFCANAYALAPMFAEPFMYANHDFPQVQRVYEMAQVLHTGKLPVRWSDNLGYGYGYPIFNYYAPLPYTVGALISFTGTGPILATKIMIGIGFILAQITMYYSTKPLWGKKGALISALLYGFAPYHASQMYVRGSIAEMYAYAFLPLVIAGLISCFSNTTDKIRKLIYSAGLALLLQSHTVTIYIFGVLMGVYILITLLMLAAVKRSMLVSWFKNTLAYLIWGGALSAFFVVPAMSEVKYIRISLDNGNEINYKDHFIELAQLWEGKWWFGLSRAGVIDDEMSFILGKGLIALGIAALIVALIHYIKPVAHKYNILGNKNRNIVVVMSLLSALFTYIMTVNSLWIWESVPRFNIIQFPWRFLMFASCTLAFAAGSLALLLKPIQNYKLVTGTVFTIAILSITLHGLFPLADPVRGSYSVYQVEYFWEFDDKAMTDKYLLTYFASRTDEYLPKNALKVEEFEQIAQDNVRCTVDCTVLEKNIQPNKYTYVLESTDTGYAEFERNYFPGFSMTRNGKKQEIVVGQYNRIGTELEKGTNTITISFGETPLRHAANTVSWSALIGLLYLYWRDSRKPTTLYSDESGSNT